MRMKPRQVFNTVALIKSLRFSGTLFWVGVLTVLAALRPVFAEETVSYGYDARSRLVRVDYRSGLSCAYSYDAAGNITTLQRTLRADQDGDFLPDTLEHAGACPFSEDADSDDDGIPDGLEDMNHNGVVDPDETDPCSPDTDGDGIQDGTELGHTAPIDDPDGAGPLEGTDPTVFEADLDPDSRTNPRLLDSDGDGVSDGVEDSNHNGRVDPGEGDPSLVPTRRISGTLYTADGAPMAAPVLVKAYSGNACSDLHWEGSTWSTAGTGAYVLEPLGKGSYYLFAQPGGTDFMAEWYTAAGDAFGCSDAHTVSLSAQPEVTGKDIHLNPAGVVAGTVLDAAGGLLAETGTIYVRLYEQDACTGSLVKTASLNPDDGGFAMSGLNAGTYYILVDAGASGYRNEWWSTGENAHLCTNAEPVTVTAAAQIDPIEIRLDPGGSIVGAVYQDDGATAVTGEDLVIEAFRENGCTGGAAAAALVDAATGKYRFTGLESGTYTLRANPLSGAYIGEWWSESGDAFNCLQAATVTVTAPEQTAGIDFKLDQGGFISGTVFQSDGATPVTAPVTIGFYPYQSGSTAGCGVPLVTYTQPFDNGIYHQALPPGKYYMRIDPTGTDYAVAWWNSSGGALSCESGGYTTVLAGVEASEKNFKLQPASTISGHIYQSDGVTPVASPLHVVAYSNDPCNMREITQGAYDPQTGHYVIDNLSNGPITVWVNAQGTSYADEWWSAAGDAYFCFQATHVDVTEHLDVTDRDILLDIGGEISGTLFTQDGTTPVAEPITVGIYPEAPCDGYRKIKTVVSDPETGRFAFERQGPGTYGLMADAANESEYIDEWWSTAGDAFDCDGAMVFALAGGVDETGKDFELDRKATLSGALLKEDGAPMNRSYYVYLYPEDPCHGSYIDRVRSNSSTGAFAFSGLKPGRYHVFADTAFVVYAQEWWSEAGDAFACNEADEIVVNSGEDVSGLVLQLEPGGQISGTLYKDDGVTPVPDRTRIRLYRGDPCDPEYLTNKYTQTNTGLFQFTALAPGGYFLQVDSIYYYPEWWSSTGGDVACEAAEPITLTGVGATVAATGFAVTEKAVIAGHVSPIDSEKSLGTMRVYLYSADPPCNAYYVTYDSVAQDGSYRLRGLEGGTYFVWAYYEYSDFMPVWWSSADEAFACDQAEGVAVADGQQRSGIDFQLHQKGRISGTVLSEAGTPIDSERMFALYYQGESACTATYRGGTAVDDSTGGYTISGLDPGSYFLRTRSRYPLDSDYVPEWWSAAGDAVDCSKATAVTVSLDETVSPIDFRLNDCSTYGERAANDDLAAALEIAGPSGTLVANNYCATAENGEPDHAGAAPHASLWWHWTAEENVNMVVDTQDSEVDTVLAVYTGDTVDALSLVAENDDADFQPWSQVTFAAKAGTTYRMAVDSPFDSPGRLVINYSAQASVPGDLDGDRVVTLADLISALKVSAAVPVDGGLLKTADVDGDSKAGIPEAVFILQRLGGLRD
jgi:YD repeat-containing protein